MKSLLALLLIALVLAGCGKQQHAPRFPLYAPIGHDSAALAERAQHQTQDAER